MRELADAERIRAFMRALGRAADGEVACYFTGGATAVLLGWRISTIDVDALLDPETDVLLRSIQELKEQLRINVEALVERGLVDPARAQLYFEAIEPDLYRFPAVDPASFRRRVEEAFAPSGSA